LNKILLTESCAMRYRFSLLQLLPRPKREKYVINTNVTGWRTLRNEPALYICGIKTWSVLTKLNWSTQTIWACRIYILKMRHKACECTLLLTVPTAEILSLWTGIHMIWYMIRYDMIYDMMWCDMIYDMI
jgi:hypothetical protein